MNTSSTDLHKLLRSRKQTIAIAESCTGGLISHLITNNPGSSKYFKLGIVAYSEEAKKSILGVDPEILRKFSAVSAETAIAMALGVRDLARTDIGVGVTGTADPTKGVVHIAAVNSAHIIEKQYKFRGGREEIKLQVADTVFTLIANLLTKSNRNM
jgi:nicotinamide-nucleotide amidase